VAIGSSEEQLPSCSALVCNLRLGRHRLVPSFGLNPLTSHLKALHALTRITAGPWMCDLMLTMLSHCDTVLQPTVTAIHTVPLCPP